MSKILLLVDDDESQRVSLGILLEEEGFVVDLAASAAAGRACIEAPSAAYDLVLLDQHLGDGLGSALVPVARERLPRAVIVLVSGSVTEKERMGVAADAFIGKGMAFPDVLDILQKALARARR